MTINLAENKKIVWFLISQTITLLGSSLVQYAIIWYITLTTNSGVMMTISTLCGFLPQLAISLFAGVWADRYSRKKLIIYSDSMIAISTLILAILFLMGYNQIWLLFFISAIRSVGAGIQTPAINAVIPQIASEEKLIKVNSINSTLQSVAMLISPAISGALLAGSTLEIIFFIDVITAIIGVSILSLINIPLHEGAKENSEVGQIEHLKEGIKYVKESKFLTTFFTFHSLITFFIVPSALLTPLLVARTFGDDVWLLTLNEMAFFAGSIIGGIILSFWGGLKNRIKMIALSCILFGVFNILLGISTFLWIYLGIMAILGIVVPFFNAPAISLLQEETTGEIQGRIFSIVQIIGTAVLPLGMVIFGPLSDILSIESLLIITGILLGLTGIFLLKNKIMNHEQIENM